MISRYEASRIADLSINVLIQRTLIEVSEEILDAAEVGLYSCEYKLPYKKDTDIGKRLELEIKSTLIGYTVKDIENGLSISWK